MLGHRLFSFVQRQSFHVSHVQTGRVVLPPVETQYYSCHKFELICCWCGSLDPAAEVNEQMQKRHKIVHPVCAACAASGRKPFVSAPKSLVGKRRGKKSV